MAAKEWPLDAERELWADACTYGPDSLWWFVRVAAGWHFRCVEVGQLNWLTERVHKPMLDWMQDKIEQWREDRRLATPKRPAKRWKLLILIPRGFGKSNLLTKAASLYMMLQERDMSIYIGSEVLPKAKAFLKPMKMVMSGEDPYSWFTWLFGSWYSPDRDWNNEEVVTAYRQGMGVTDPSFGTFGVETGITSKHPIGCFFDDPLSDEKLKDGGTWLEAVHTSFESIFFALRSDSMLVVPTTRYLDDDPAGRLMREEGVASWTGHEVPAEYQSLIGTDKGEWHVFFLQARDITNTTNYEKGEPILPEAGWDNEALERSERKPKKHAAQMMNNPTTGEDMELTDAQIDKMTIPRAMFPPMEYATIHIDTAFKDEERRKKGDYTAIVVWLHDIRPTGIVYLDRVMRSRKWRAEEFEAKLLWVFFDLKRRGLRVRALTDEAEQGGKRGVYRQRLTDLLGGSGIMIPEIFQFNRSGTRKVLRIREAANYWAAGYVRIADDCENLAAMKYEMTHIGLTGKMGDDVSDAGADVFRPETWRGREFFFRDEQPALPVQPGDDVLKEQWNRDMHRLELDLFPERFPNEMLDDPQPYIGEGESDSDDGFFR